MKHCMSMYYLVEMMKMAFQKHSKECFVNGRDTMELYDVFYDLFLSPFEENNFAKFDFDIPDIENFPPAHADDEIERFKFFAAIQKFCENQLANDEHSRQYVIQQKYNDDNDLASCISFMQLIKRGGFLDLHVVVRSQNFEKNFVYDNYTFFKCLKIASEKTGIPAGTIHVKIISLHVFV